MIAVAVTLGLDSGSNGGGDGGPGIGNGSVIGNETFLSLSSMANLSSSVQVDDYEEEVVVVSDRGEMDDAQQGDEDASCEHGLQLLLIIKTTLLAVSLLLEIFMARLALRGTMWDVKPRRLMEYVLYSRLRTLTIELTTK